MKSEKVLVILSLAVVGLFAALLLGSSASPMLGDYAEWTYHGVLLQHVLQGKAEAAYQLKSYPVPNSLTTVGLGLLMLVLPWSVAAKVWLLIEIALGMTSIVALRRAMGDGQMWSFIVLLPAVVLGIGFWAGFSNFMFGAYFALLLSAMLMRGVESRWRYGGLLVLTFLSHMIPFGFAVLVLFFYALQAGRWRLLKQAVPAFMLCAWYFVGRILHGNVDGQAGMVASVKYGSVTFVLFKANTYLKEWGFLNPAYGEHDSVLLRVGGETIFLIMLLISLLIGVAMLILMVRAGARSLSEGRRDRFLWRAVSLFFACSLFMPGAAAGISDPGGRMMQVALWCGACLVVCRRGWLRAALAGGALVLLVNDCFLLDRVALQTSPTIGETSSRFPAVVRVFGHVYYADRWEDYAALREGRMKADIYPTAMFLKK